MERYGPPSGNAMALERVEEGDCTEDENVTSLMELSNMTIIVRCFVVSSKNSVGFILKMIAILQQFTRNHCHKRLCKEKLQTFFVFVSSPSFYMYIIVTEI
jgi:hypothetical protein